MPPRPRAGRVSWIRLALGNDGDGTPQLRAGARHAPGAAEELRAARVFDPDLQRRGRSGRSVGDRSAHAVTLRLQRKALRAGIELAPHPLRAAPVFADDANAAVVVVA